jgi:hypothetical protein
LTVAADPKSSVDPGAVVPIPSHEFDESTDKNEPTCKLTFGFVVPIPIFELVSHIMEFPIVDPDVNFVM